MNMNHSVLICVPPPAVWGVWKPWIINSDPLFLHIPSMALILSISSPITSRRNFWQQQQRIQIFCVLSLSTESHRRRLRIPTNPESKKVVKLRETEIKNRTQSLPNKLCQLVTVKPNHHVFRNMCFPCLWTPEPFRGSISHLITMLSPVTSESSKQVFSGAFSQYFVARVATCLKRLPGIRFIISIIMYKNQLRRWGSSEHIVFVAISRISKWSNSVLFMFFTRGFTSIWGN